MAEYVPTYFRWNGVETDCSTAPPNVELMCSP